MKRNHFIATVLALCLALGLTACGLYPGRRIVWGNGAVDVRTLALPETPGGLSLRLDGVSFQFTDRDAIDLTVMIDETLDRSAILETDGNLLSRLRLEYDSARGEISLRGPRAMAFSPTRFTLTVGAPVRALVAYGTWNIRCSCPSVKACSIRTDGDCGGDFSFGKLDRLDMNLGGIARMKLSSPGITDCKITTDGDIDGDFALGAVDSLDMNLGGICRAAVSGTARRAALALEGDAKISAFGLTARDADITISGIGHCEITAEERLRVRIDGDGSVIYAGSPTLSQTVDGIGVVKARDQGD